MPTFSIIIPLYNREDLIRETLDTVKNQTYDDFECIVIDDHSSDASFELASQNGKDNRFIVKRRSGTKKGAPVCRNEGIDLASGRYLMFLDSDDLMDPECLEQRLNYIKEAPPVDFYVFPLAYFQEDNYMADYLCSNISGENDLKAFVSYTGGWQVSSTVFRADFLKNSHYFDEEATSWQDVEFHLRAIAKSTNYLKFHNAFPDVYVRLSGDNRITTADWSYLKIASRIKLYGKIEKELNQPELERYFFLLNFKYLEIAARTLDRQEYIQLRKLWKKEVNKQARSYSWKQRYLDLQNFLSRNKLYYLGSFLYKFIRKVPGANPTIPLKRRKLKEAIDVRQRLSEGKV